ncbi:HAMP domain-containing sensor histidine kinase [[Phormidium] sp. ETS-05]|uniref:GAF domain-containing sensor histidine kinase n=1 Tax=[Phormidium] sp. ETS-05 TaxID=222819 RepID=UPI0018EF0B50|nr:HAMP domain-containing sensor histidine kinase [[Phormidium] sp. ETS-05]
MPASSEFVALCQAQVALLARTLGATSNPDRGRVSIAVYLTDELASGERGNLIPVVVYPESKASPGVGAVVWTENNGPALLPEAGAPRTRVKLLSGGAELPETAPEMAFPVEVGRDLLAEPTEGEAFGDFWQPGVEPELQPQEQLVLPLIHEEVVMGLLVASRQESPWNDTERGQIEQIAKTLALARILDRRGGWLQEQLRQKQLRQAQTEDLLDNILHQVRSPLTALRTFGKLLLKRLLPTDANRPIADSILRESDRIRELLEILDEAIVPEPEEITPISIPVAVQPEGPPNTTPVQPPGALLPAAPRAATDVAVVLVPLLMSALAIASDRNLECSAHIPDNLPPVLANPPALREVLSNLIDNALKYTPAKGRIYIQAAARNQQVAIAVSDTGPGIPPEDLPHLFQRHYRGVMGASDIPGTGLGLAIARDLVHQMHGEILVFSPADPRWFPPDNPPPAGGGTTFILLLPVAP